MRTLSRLRTFGVLEGWSFLLLLFVAMPLKYRLGLPIAVRIAGSVHGLLFLMFVWALFEAASEHAWAPRRWLTAFAASVIPGGTFVLDRVLKREMAGQVAVNESP